MPDCCLEYKRGRDEIKIVTCGDRFQIAGILDSPEVLMIIKHLLEEGFEEIERD